MDPLLCATGCSTAETDESELSELAFLELLTELSTSPWTRDVPALDSLLYHGRRTEALLAKLGHSPLDDALAARLEAELAKRYARFEVRLVDEEGNATVRLDGTHLHLGERTHMHPELALDVQPPEITGTVARVGLDRLWTRL